MRLIPKKMIKLLMIISIIVFFIAVFASSIKPNTREGYNALSGMEGPISKSDFHVILNECVNNVINHEDELSVFDSSYKKDNINVDTNLTDMQNIQNLLNIIKKQDIQIKKMLPNYLLNQDLDGLRDGSLLMPIASDLERKSSKPEKPLECDINVIDATIANYDQLIKDNAGDDDDHKNTRNMYNSKIIQLNARKAELDGYKKNNQVDPNCLPSLSKGDAEGILDGYYANALSKIIKSQDLSMDVIKNKIKTEITNFYSRPIFTNKEETIENPYL